MVFKCPCNTLQLPTYENNSHWQGPAAGLPQGKGPSTSMHAITTLALETLARLHTFLSIDLSLHEAPGNTQSALHKHFMTIQTGKTGNSM
jgi:hypothetical protein